MHDIFVSLADCNFSKPSPILPCRPGPEVDKHSSGLQRKRCKPVTAGPIAWLRSLEIIVRAIAVIAPLMCQITASSAFEANARARATSRPKAGDRFAKFIDQASGRFAVPARWILAVMRVESGGDAYAISSRGAMGLMQLMPGTWVELSGRYDLGLDPFDAHDNIFAGTAYLKELHDRFGSAGFLAAYHAGPSRYEQHLATGRPLPQETTAYVAAVTLLLDNDQGEHAAADGRRALPWREAPLFVERARAP